MRSAPSLRQTEEVEGGGRREGGTGCVCEVMVVVVVGRVATKVKGVCDYIGKSHLPLTKAGTHTHEKAHISVFFSHIKMPALPSLRR